jgi:hypothetical protein
MKSFSFTIVFTSRIAPSARTANHSGSEAASIASSASSVLQSDVTGFQFPAITTTSRVCVGLYCDVVIVHAEPRAMCVH